MIIIVMRFEFQSWRWELITRRKFIWSKSLKSIYFLKYKQQSRKLIVKRIKRINYQINRKMEKKNWKFWLNENLVVKKQNLIYENITNQLHKKHEITKRRNRNEYKKLWLRTKRLVKFFHIKIRKIKK